MPKEDLCIEPQTLFTQGPGTNQIRIPIFRNATCIEIFRIAGERADRHITAITAPGNADAFRADLLEAAQEFGGIQTVLGIADAPVVIVGAFELFAVAGRAAIVW